MIDTPEKLKSILLNVSNIIKRITDNHAFKHLLIHEALNVLLNIPRLRLLIVCLQVHHFVLVLTMSIFLSRIHCIYLFVYLTKQICSVYNY